MKKKYWTWIVVIGILLLVWWFVSNGQKANDG